MAMISFNRKNIIPDKSIVIDALFIGISVTVVSFLVDFFGLTPFINWFPPAMRLFVYVVIGVYIRRLIDLKIFNREVI